MIPLGLAQQVTNNQKPKTTPKAKPKVSDNLAMVMAAVDMHLGTKQGDPRREAIKSYILSKDPTGNDAERLSHEALAAQNPLMNVVNPPKPQTRPTGAPSPLTDEEVAKRADVARRRQIQTNPKSTPAEVIGSYRPRNNPTKTQANQRYNPDTPEYKMREYDESQGFGVTSGVRPPGVSDDAWQARMRQREVATGSGQWVEDPEQAMMRGAAFNPRTGMNSPTTRSEANVAVGKNIDRLSKENSPGAALGKVVGGVTKYSGQAFSDTYFNGLRPAIYEAEIKGGRTPKQAKELLDTFDDYAGQFAQVLASIVTGGASAAAAGTRFANALKGMNHAAQVQLAPMVLQLSDPRTTPEERVAMIQQMAKEPSTWLMVIGHGLPKAIRAAVPVDTSSVKGLDMRRSAIVMKGVQDMQSGIPVEPAAKAHIKTAAEKLGNPDPDAVFQTQVELVQKGASPEDALNAAKVIHSVAEPVNEGGRHKIQDSEQPVVPNPSFLEEGDLDILAPTPKRTPAKVQKPVAEPAAVEGQKWESKVAHVDNRHGENIFEAVATADGKIIGVVDYSEVRGNVVIKHVEVLPEWRRKGVATSLYDAIKAEHPGAKMDTLGSRTNEGKAFRKAYDIKYPANKTQVQNTPETAAPSNDRQIKPTPTDTPQPAPKAVEGESVQPAKPAETPNVRKPTVAELDFMDEPKPKAVKAPKPEPKVETPENAPFPINARGNRTSINGAVAYPRSVGAKFSTEEIASVKEWGQANGYHINATPTKISIIGDSGGAIADSINSAKSLTNAEVESKAKLDAYNTRQAQTQAENAKTVSSNAGVWLDSTFGADFANDFNKAALVRFIEGKDAKFQGGASRKWADGLEKLGITPDDARVALSKIKEAYEASQPTKSETAQAVESVKPAKPVEVPTVRKPTVAELDFMDEPKPKPAPKAQEPKAAVGKELWQMTAEDAVKADPSYAAYQELGSPDLIIYHDTQIRDARFNSMLDAIKRGENVPDSAISEYVMAGQQSKTIDVRKQIVQNARRLAREGKSSSELSAMDGAYVRESLAIRDGEKASPKPAPVKGGKEMRRLTVGGADHETGGAKTEQVLSAPVDVGAPEGIDYFIGRRSVDNRWVVSNGEIAPIGFGDTREAAIAKARKFYERAPTKSAAAKANLKAAVSEFLDESNKLGARWSPEQEAVKLQKAINVAKRAAEYGWATVEDAIKATAEVFGRKLQKQEERVLRQAWESVHGKPEPTKHSEPATPIKPPKPPQNASAEPETPNKGYQGFTHADTARLREVYGLPAYEKSGKSLDVLVKEAYDQGHVKNAENIAREVIDKPRPLSAQENVAVLLGMDKAVTAEEAATAALGKGYADKLPPSEIAKLEFDQAHANDLANTFISAHELSGSEQGRALGSRRIIMNRGYGPDTLRYKAQSALKRGLKPEESAKVAELGNAVKDAEAKVSEVEGKVNTRQIDAAIKTHKTARASSNRFFTEDRYQAIKAKRGKGGVGSNKRRGASVNWAEEFADLIYVAGYHIERGVRSSAEFIAKVREDIPEATDADIARAANEAVAQKRSNAEPKKPPTKLTLPQMLKELSEIGGIQDEAAKANLAELRAKAQEISKLPEEKSMEAMQGWREEIIKLQRNLNRGSKQGADVFTSGKHTVNDPELNAARAKLYAAKKEADAWIKHLENRTRRESIGAVRRGLEDVWDVLGLPRALMTSADASGIFRQGWILALTRQKAALEGISMMKKGAWTEEKFNAAESQLMHKYEQSGRLAEMKDAGLEILEAGNGIGPHQEDYATRITGAKIKGREVFAHVKISERAFALESNAKRMFAFDQIASAIESDGVKLTRAERQGLANYIDVTAGLAHVKNGHGMARIFFSPKYWLSRIQFMMGQPIAKAGSPRMQKAIAAEYVKFYTVTATLLGLAAAGGLTTLDAQDSDFGKIKFGNTRIDLTGGLGTHFIAMMRLGAHFLDKTMGTKLHEGSGSYQAESYLRSRLAPLPGAAYSYTFGRKDGKPTNAIGMETGPGETARELVLPLTVSQGVRDAQEGIPPEQISLAVIANLLGLSASSYDKSKRESKAKPKATSKSKVEYAGRTYAGRTR